jgi:hypothetical protein
MISFDNTDNFVRGRELGGEFLIKPATGVDDARASFGGQALLRLVEDRTGGTRFLKRSDFSPADLKPFLPNIMIMQVVFGDDGLVCDGIIRLMGGALTIFYGQFTGKSVLDHPSDSGRRFVMAANAAIEARTAAIGNAVQTTPDKPTFKIATCIVPIVNDAGVVIQTIGHIQLFNQYGLELAPHL